MHTSRNRHQVLTPLRATSSWKPSSNDDGREIDVLPPPMVTESSDLADPKYQLYTTEL
jgi:hypothetical protein